MTNTNGEVPVKDAEAETGAEKLACGTPTSGSPRNDFPSSGQPAPSPTGTDSSSEAGRCDSDCIGSSDTAESDDVDSISDDDADSTRNDDDHSTRSDDDGAPETKRRRMRPKAFEEKSVKDIFLHCVLKQEHIKVIVPSMLVGAGRKLRVKEFQLEPEKLPQPLVNIGNLEMGKLGFLPDSFAS